MLTPDDIIAIEAELCRRDFAYFVRQAWQYVCADGLVWEAPQEIISLHLQAVRDGKFPDNHTLTISVPPGSSKSLMTSVLYPAWIWTSTPSHSFICATHTSALTQRFASRFRALVESEWYTTHFHVTLTDDTNSKLAMKNTSMGERLGVSVGGSITGSHADTHVCDDLVDASDADNVPALEAANEWYDTVLSSRFKTATKTSSILIAQRLNTIDVIAHVAQRPTTIQLSLPAVLDGPPCVTPVWTDPRRQGELLAPTRLPQQVLDIRRTALGSYQYEAQYQQRPTPRTGGLVKQEWLNHTYNTLPFKFERVSLIADCANTGLNDPTALLVVGVHQAKLYLIDFVCRPMDFPCLISTITTMRNQYKPTEICIEAASSGHAAIQTLRQSIPNVIDLKPQGSKSERLLAATPMLEAGSVLFPAQGGWLSDFRAEVLAFPHARHDESVDVLAYAVNRLLSQGPSPEAILKGYQVAAKRLGLM